MANGTLSLGRVDAFGTRVAGTQVALAVVDEGGVGLVGLAERAHLGAAADHRILGQIVLGFGLRRHHGGATVGGLLQLRVAPRWPVHAVAIIELLRVRRRVGQFARLQVGFHLGPVVHHFRTAVRQAEQTKFGYTVALKS